MASEFEKIQKKFEKYLKKCEEAIERNTYWDTKDLEELYKETRVKPYLSEKLMKTAHKLFEDCVRVGTLHEFRKLYEITGYRPKLSEELVQSRAIAAAREGEVGWLEALYKITGKKPKIPESYVQEGFAYCMREGKLNAFKKLKEFTGIKPSEDVYKIRRKKEEGESDYYYYYTPPIRGWIYIITILLFGLLLFFLSGIVPNLSAFIAKVIKPLPLPWELYAVTAMLVVLGIAIIAFRKRKARA